MKEKDQLKQNLLAQMTVEESKKETMLEIINLLTRANNLFRDTFKKPLREIQVAKESVIEISMKK